MNKWPLQDAKNQFSQVVELSQKRGPQTATRHGEPVVVIVSADDFRKMARPKESVAEFFAPLRRSGLRLVRCRDLPRGAKPTLALASKSSQSFGFAFHLLNRPRPGLSLPEDFRYDNPQNAGAKE